MIVNAISSLNFKTNKHKEKSVSCPKVQTFQNSSFSPLKSDTISFGRRLSLEEAVKLFDKYQPKIKNFVSYSLPVHNSEIASKMSYSYKKETFEALFEHAKKNGVFDLNIDPKTNYVQTSLINAKENPLMSKLVWVTDSCNLMPLLKTNHPQACVPLMENMSAYYAKQQRSFDRIINDPLKFELNHDWPNTAKQGVGHVFNPKNGVSHKWFAKTRLDSMGLYIQTMTTLISNGFKGKNYGYKTAAQVSDNAIESIANSTAYLKKIIYPYAKDTGAWEEKTFNLTTSSDVAIINESFRKILDLMYSPTKDKEVLAIRKRLLNAKNGKVFKDEEGLRDMLKLGEYRIKTNSLDEIPLERELDGALSFIYKTETFDKNVVKDVEESMRRLEILEKGTDKSGGIVRENGVLRYHKDTYLHLNYDLGGKPEYNTQKKFPPKTEAQWFMVSDISTAYGKQVEKLLNKIEQDKGNASSEIRELLFEALSKQIEYVNRAYARITGKESYKANGVKCLENQVPEAYQAVNNSNGNIKFVPGTHSPLGWAQASLFEASEKLLENLSRIENSAIASWA